jgi:hypothetical protein
MVGRLTVELRSGSVSGRVRRFTFEFGKKPRTTNTVVRATPIPSSHPPPQVHTRREPRGVCATRGYNVMAKRSRRGTQKARTSALPASAAPEIQIFWNTATQEQIWRRSKSVSAGPSSSRLNCENAMVSRKARWLPPRRAEGVLIRPAIVVPVEHYTPERKAEFLLSTATSAKDYDRARREVKKLGLDPDAIPHRRPR